MFDDERLNRRRNGVAGVDSVLPEELAGFGGDVEGLHLFYLFVWSHWFCFCHVKTSLDIQHIRTRSP